MKKILTLFCTLTIFSLNAQRNEVGIFTGTSYYLGDINPSMHFSLAKPAGGLIYRYILNPRWALKMDGIYGSVESSDAYVRFNKERNLSFKSSLFEVSTQIELNFFPYYTGNTDKDYFTPYIFAGISFFSFNPKANYNGKWYDLQPLGTEGQGTSLYPDRKPYSLVGLSYPFGLGVKYSVGAKLCIGAEWGLRKTNTDYIDDVSTTYPNLAIVSAENTPIAAVFADRSLSALENHTDHTDLQRGNSSTNDWYSYAGLFITIKFKVKKSRACSAYSTHNKKFKDLIKND